MKRFFFSVVLVISTFGISFTQVKVGDNVPNFTAIDQDGSEWALRRQLREADYLVVYFYPAAFTGGCTAQACSYRDQKSELAAVGAQVVGVSGDKPETLELFALEHALNFTLLSDETGEISTIFGVPHGEGGSISREVQGRDLELERGTTIQRWTFILDNQGTLIYKDTEVDAAADSNKVVEFLSSR